MSDEIFEVIEPLVDGITNLISSAYTKDLVEMKEASQVIADQTDKLVELVKERVININDQILVNEMVISIKNVSSKVVALRLAYNNVAKSDEKQYKQAFAVAAKEVGDSLRELMYTMDTSYAKRISEAVKKAKPLVKIIGTSARTSKDVLLDNAKNFASANIVVIQAGEDASKATLDNEKREVFGECVSDIKKYSSDLIIACRNLSDRPNSEELIDKVVSLEQFLLAAYLRLESTAKILKELSYFGRIGATISELDDLLGRLEHLKQTSNRCYNAIGTNDYLNEAKEVTQQVVALFKEAQKVLDKTDDPVIKNKLQQLMGSLKSKASEFVKASKEKHQNPNMNGGRVKEAKKELDDCIDHLYSLFDPHTKRGLNQQVIYGTEVILVIADNLISSSRSKDDTSTFSKDLLLCADQVVVDTETLASQTENVMVGKKIKGVSREIRVLCTQLIEVSNSPSLNYSSQQKQDSLRNNLEKKLYELKNMAIDWQKYEEEYERKKEEERKRKEEEERRKMGDSLLVKAAKEQSNNANIVAREAEKYANLLKDPLLKQQILQGANNVKLLGEKLVKSAEKYDKEPNNREWEEEYSEAQRKLGEGIGYIVKLTNNNSLLESFGGLERLLGGSREGVKLAEELMKFIEDINLKMKKDPSFTVEGSKLITEKTKQLASILRQMAKEETEPKFKEQFTTFANGLNDKALQIKILSAVNLAEGGSKNSNQVSSACNVLKTNLSDLVSALHVAALQSSIRQTNKQSEAIAKLAQAFINTNK
eukprot:TRINITY_DN8608_c0_g1_i1.p1 TRINITY_DN8608_c0_g1~~TRINITY_DN8608_c0_g1_i1.p1  ORF type:complete len:767 (+),score=268.03 TRINITY_DN8608_c0_g1_i1:22-2322(+)